MKKRYGQHFLFDPNILRRIVTFAEVGPDNTVLEIGPGAGTLTRELAAVAKHVIAIEIDTDLIEPLRANAAANVEIIEGDALEFDFQRLPPTPIQVVGNLPYNVATLLFKRFIEHRARIQSVTAMIQKEVADRMTAAHDTEAYGPLSVLVQHYATATRGFNVPRGAFRPRPKVDSTVIRLEWRPDVPDARGFTDFVHAAFGERRKKLVNNLRRILPQHSLNSIYESLSVLGISKDARPEELSIGEFFRVYNQLCRH